MKQQKKKFSISTTFFDTLEEAIEQYEKWEDDGVLKEGTTIIECSKLHVPHKEIIITWKKEEV